MFKEAPYKVAFYYHCTHYPGACDRCNSRARSQRGNFLQIRPTRGAGRYSTMAMATIMTMTMTKVKEGKAVVSGTSTLIGSIATLLSSVQRFFICDLFKDDHDDDDDHGSADTLLSSVHL